MFSQWPIRNKVLVGIGLLLVIVLTLSWSGFHGVYAYRGVVRGFRGRAEELPLAQTLSAQVGELHLVVAQVDGARAVSSTATLTDVEQRTILEQFLAHLHAVHGTLAQYRHQLQRNDAEESRINDSHSEWETLHRIDAALERVVETTSGTGWTSDDLQLEQTNVELERLQDLCWELPSYLHKRLHNYAGEVRTQYRALIVITWVTTVLGACCWRCSSAVLCLGVSPVADLD